MFDKEIEALLEEFGLNDDAEDFAAEDDFDLDDLDGEW